MYNIANVTGNEYLTRKETAQLLRVSLPTLKKHTKNGVIKAYKFGGKVLFKTTEISTALKTLS